MLSDQELEEILNRGENDHVEFTESTNDLDKFRKAICAFANDLPDHKKPGFVCIGIKDDGSCADLLVNDQLLQKLGGLRDDGKILPFPGMEVWKTNLNGSEVAVIRVAPSDNPPIKVAGVCWISVGPGRAKASAEEERRLTEKRSWGNMPCDMQEVGGAAVKPDLDMRKFENEYLPAAVSPEVLEENDRSIEEQLQALRLTTQNGTPTVTAILMLGKDPCDWFPGAYIQFVRYAGNAVTDLISDQKEIRGTLPAQLIELDKLLQVNIRIELDTSGETHRERPDYPLAALRELTRNAVIHRDYQGSNAPVRIFWLEDSIEIISPGSPYGAVTRENFGKDITDYRNPTIAEAMKNMGFMQRFGIGIATACRALEENGNPPLKFDVQDTFILATIGKRQ